jgi:hypothetical protein
MHIRRILNQYNIKTFFSNTPNCRNLTKQNQDLTIQQLSDIVYKIPCQSCEKFYIGQTKQKFAQRQKQHTTAIAKNDQTNALAKHHEEEKHLPKWEEATSIFHETNLTKRLILETATIEIYRTSTTNLTSGPYRAVRQLIPTNFPWPEGATNKSTRTREN